VQLSLKPIKRLSSQGMPFFMKSLIFSVGQRFEGFVGFGGGEVFA
jgi:hypothetical protein